MLFNSISFLFFFPAVFIAYWLLPKGYRKYLLILASCYFYMAFVPEYILILFALIGIDFFLAKKIEQEEVQKGRYLFLSIASSLFILFLFKYFNFFNENIDALATFLGFNYTPLLLQIALPLGLSFHVFQSLSYVIEVYKGRYKAEQHLPTYVLYVLFFPQLVAGPIERPQNLLPQLNSVHEFNHVQVRQGLEQMLWGFFKKLVIADNIAQIINPLYTNLPQESSLLFCIAILFSYQLYCDFSGYSDIALGSAKMLGYELQINFNRPFAARTLSDFWRRWHISLSSWLRDYLYYPLALATGKKSTLKLHISLLATFFLIGLWHGANWTFVIFGLVHGIYLVFELATEKYRKALRSFLKLDMFPMFLHTAQVLTVFFLATLSFIFFRSENVSQAIWFFKNLFTIPNMSFIQDGLLSTLSAPVGTIVFFVTLLAMIFMEYVQYVQAKQGTLFIFENGHKAFRYGWYYMLTVTILFFGYFGAETFIYFQF